MKINLAGIFKKPSATAVISILLALVGWFVVVYSISPSDTNELTGVPVQITLPSGSDLNIVEGGKQTVTVKVDGMRYNIGNLRPDEVILRAVLTDVITPGTYALRIDAVKPQDDRYEVVSIYPETINVTFDRQTTKTLDIEQEIMGLTVPDDSYLLGDITIEPGKITVQGPEKEVDRIVRAVIKAEFKEPVTSTQMVTLPVVFLDAVGQEVKTKQSGEGYVSANYETTTVLIPVKVVKELPLTFSFVNAPDDFPAELLEHTISNEFITVAATEDIMSRYFEIQVGHIDLSQLDLTRTNSVTFDIELPENVDNCNNIETVVVDFTVSDIGSKTIRIKKIQPLNVPPDYDVQIVTSNLNVRLVGDQKTLDSLLTASVIAEIDFSSQDIMTGQYQMPINIYMPSDEFVWAIGKYNAVVNVTSK